MGRQSGLAVPDRSCMGLEILRVYGSVRSGAPHHTGLTLCPLTKADVSLSGLRDVGTEDVKTPIEDGSVNILIV